MVLPKEMRLRGYKCFEYIHKHGRRYKGNSMILKITKAKNKSTNYSSVNSHTDCFKCAVSISNKVSKKAVIRNHLRRVIHDHLRKKKFYKHQLENNWALLSLFPNCLDKNPKNLLKEFDQLLFEASL